MTKHFLKKHKRIVFFFFIILFLIYLGNIITNDIFSSRIDISEEMTESIPAFYQYDLRWGNQTYGNQKIKINGCGPTCLAMVYCGLTRDSSYNPRRMAKMAEKSGYYIEGQGTSWNLMTEGANQLGLHYESVSADATSVIQTLNDKKPIICSVGPGDFTTEGHFLVLTGVREDGMISLHDPNSKRHSQQGWEIDRLLPQIKAMWAYWI